MAGGRENFTLAAALALGCLSFACQSLDAYANERDEVEADAVYPWSAEDLGGSIIVERLYHDVIGSLDAPSIDPHENHNVLRTAILSSFDTVLVVSAYHRRYLDPQLDESEIQLFAWTDDYLFEVAFSDIPLDPSPIKNGNHFTRTVHRYYVDITKEEYDRLSKVWFESGVMEEPKYYPSHRLCADGVGYWTEAKVNNHYNLFSRDFCSRRFREDFLYSEFLLDFAADKIPELAKKLDKLKAKVLETDTRNN